MTVRSSALLLASLTMLSACASAASEAPPPTPLDPACAARDDAPLPPNSGVVRGIVKDRTTDEPIEDAYVLLQCACLPEMLEAVTDARGFYSFADLPSGNYKAQVLAGRANISKIFQLPRGGKFRANYSLDPNEAEVVEIVVEAAPVPRQCVTMPLDPDELSRADVRRLRPR